jgi:hypothetical protein
MNFLTMDMMVSFLRAVCSRQVRLMYNVSFFYFISTRLGNNVRLSFPRRGW